MPGGGLIADAGTRPPARSQRELLALATALSVLALGCPVCNNLVVLLLGSAGALAI